MWKYCLVLYIVFQAECFSDDYVIVRSLFSNGGKTVSNTDFTMPGSLGQDVAGTSQDANFRMIHGFWTSNKILDLQRVSLFSGWNIISTYINMPDPSMQVIRSNILDKVVIVKNNLGEIYYPEFEIITIGDWNPYEGY